MPVQPGHGASLNISSNSTSDDQVSAGAANHGQQLHGVRRRVGAISIGIDNISGPGGENPCVNGRTITSSQIGDYNGGFLSSDLNRGVDRTVVDNQNLPIGFGITVENVLALGQELRERRSLVQTGDD